MNWQRSLPSWLSLGVLAAIVVGVLFVVGWIKPYLNGPDLALTTIYRPKPVPVRVETVKWLKGDTRVKTERVEVPVEVIREVPAKVEKQLLGFGLSLKDLQAKKEELVDVLDVPRAPHGGEMALTVNTETGKIDGTFKPKAAPLIEFGGIRAAGGAFDPIAKRIVGYYRQDLIRVGPVVVNGRVSAGAPLAVGASSSNGRRVLDYGVEIGAEIRF
jgi:hypothetical protein